MNKIQNICYFYLLPFRYYMERESECTKSGVLVTNNNLRSFENCDHNENEKCTNLTNNYRMV